MNLTKQTKKEISLGELATHLGGELVGDPDLIIQGVGEIQHAQPGEITFLANPRYASYLKSTRASAILIDSRAPDLPDIPYIKVPDAYFAFRETLCLMYPRPEYLQPGVHPTAVLAEGVTLGAEVAIGPQVYLGRGVSVGEGTVIMPGCVILDHSQIGQNCLLYPLVSVREYCFIGNRVIIHNGAVIGSDGFGYAQKEGKYYKIPQVGTVVIEDDVEIGANVTIDRATVGETRIARGCKIDNLVHLAHNVQVGEHTAIAAQTGISGSTRIGKQVVMGGQVGSVGHISIGDRVMVGAQSGISKNVPQGQVIFGTPARPIMEAKRIEAALRNLPGLLKRVRALEQRLAELEEKTQNSS